MKMLKKENLNLIFISLLLLFSFSGYLAPKYYNYNIKSLNNKNLIEVSTLIDNQNEIAINTDCKKNLYQIVDQNDNKIHDNLDTKLNSIKIYKECKKSSISSLSQSNSLISIDKIDIVIQFYNDFDYSNIIPIFEKNGGSIEFTYKSAINGFAGSIDYDGFSIFYTYLKENDIDFFIEEDTIGQLHLYYNSLNMRLRPYVWENFSIPYTGDKYSSIAILDTGIDEDHLFFNNDSTGKVLKFIDYVNGLNDTAYDDNGHGSHCAGIAAGLGTIKDGQNRSVATFAMNHDIYSWASDGYYEGVGAASFYVPTIGTIELECCFNDSTPFFDYVIADFYLTDAEGYPVKWLGYSTSGDWQENFTYDITSSNQFGNYKVIIIYTFKDGGGLSGCYDPDFKFRVEIHWPFDPNDYGCGNLWKGVAPNANLVGVKIFDNEGYGFLADAIMGVEWCINNRKTYNISVISMSFGFNKGEVGLINAVNNAVEKGIVAVASAGNDGASENYIGSPGDADNVITVAANNYLDEITEYSSQGGLSSSTKTRKPDITAPGGSFDQLQIFSADSNDNDAEGSYSIDAYANETYGMQGTSMSCPNVAGAVNLLIQAMGGAKSWNWNDASTSKMVKSLLLMTATETFPLQREYNSRYSPYLNRGGKDVHEGYGRINIDAAIEAWTNNLTSYANSKNINVWLNSSADNSYGKHAYAGFVNCEKGKSYLINVTVPTGADYDLHIYNYTPNAYGEPILNVSSVSIIEGKDEVINFTAGYTGKFFLVIKAIGLYIPTILIEEEEDDDETSETVFTIIEFLISPLGLILFGSVVAVISIIIIVMVKTRKKEKYDINYISRTSIE